jgi:hypothetical protein
VGKYLCKYVILMYHGGPRLCSVWTPHANHIKNQMAGSECQLANWLRCNVWHEHQSCCFCMHHLVNYVRASCLQPW